MLVTIFQHQFYLMHPLLTESGFISPLINWLIFLCVKKMNNFKKMSPCLLSGDANIQGFTGVILNMRMLVFHITHAVFLFCLGSTLPGQTTSWGQPSDVQHRVAGMLLTLWFLCCHMILVKGTSESVHTCNLGSSKDHRANPYCDDKPGSPRSSIPNAHQIGHLS